MEKHWKKLWIGIQTLLVLVCSTPILANPLIPDSAPKKTVAPTEKPPPSLTELVSASNQIQEALIDLEDNLKEIYDPTPVTKKFQESKIRIQKYSNELERWKGLKEKNLDKLALLKSMLKGEYSFIKSTLRPVEETLTEVSNEDQKWTKERKRWKQWEQSLKDEAEFSPVKGIFQEAKKNLSKGQTFLSKQLESLIDTELEGGGLQSEIYALLVEIKTLMVQGEIDITSGDGPPMYTGKYYTQFRWNWLKELEGEIRALIWPSNQFFQDNKWVLLLQLLTALLITFAIKTYRDRSPDKEKLDPFVQRPLAMGILISVVAFIAVYSAPIPLWTLLNKSIAWVALARVAVTYVTDKRYRWLIYAIPLILISLDILKFLNTPVPLFRLYIFALTVAGLVIAIRHARALSARRNILLYLAYFTVALIFGVILFAEIMGYAEFAYYSLAKTVTILALGLAAWISVRFAQAAVHWIIYSAPLQAIPIVEKHGDRIVLHALFFIRIGIALLFFSFILTSLEFYEFPNEAIENILKTGITLGQLKITVGMVLSVIIILYASLVISWFVQILLNESVFPKVPIPPGAGFSMSRLIQYTILLIGVLFALSAMGFSMTNFVILGGALGVGLGFGLQDIVKNFVSGIILLLERPIEVGHMIQLGDLECLVKKIGLRVTHVQSLDDAAIIVPNWQLISNQVINWTYSRGRMRLKIPVGVAYGSNVDQVIDILHSCAQENTYVLSYPKPEVRLNEFGECALHFLLVCRIDNLRKRGRIRSDLNTAIVKKLEEAGIEIPLPQRHVHLHNVRKEEEEL